MGSEAILIAQRMRQEAKRDWRDQSRQAGRTTRLKWNTVHCMDRYRAAPIGASGRQRTFYPGLRDIRSTHATPPLG